MFTNGYSHSLSFALPANLRAFYDAPHPAGFCGNRLAFGPMTATSASGDILPDA